jgi:hypothetical protein
MLFFEGTVSFGLYCNGDICNIAFLLVQNQAVAVTAGMSPSFRFIIFYIFSLKYKLMWDLMVFSLGKGNFLLNILQKFIMCGIAIDSR